MDLFSGAGGATRGYQLAGFHVTGVDIAPQPHYCGDEFVQADALTFPLDGFDAVHASPPCQGYTTMNNRHGSVTPKLIAETRDALVTSGRPYVIENVSGALRWMHSPVELTGEMFGLRVHRPRLFESNVLLLAPSRPRRQRDPVAVYGKQDGRRLWTRSDGSELRVADLGTASTAMGIDWMEWDELREAIPPAFTTWIGEQLISALRGGEHHSDGSSPARTLDTAAFPGRRTGSLRNMGGPGDSGSSGRSLPSGCEGTALCSLGLNKVQDATG